MFMMVTALRRMGEYSASSLVDKFFLGKDRERIRKCLTPVPLSNVFRWPGWMEKMVLWAGYEQAPWLISGHLAPSLAYWLLRYQKHLMLPSLSFPQLAINLVIFCTVGCGVLEFRQCKTLIVSKSTVLHFVAFFLEAGRCVSWWCLWARATSLEMCRSCSRIFTYIWIFVLRNRLLSTSSTSGLMADVSFTEMINTLPWTFAYCIVEKQ